MGFFHDESKQCYGFNLLNASQHLTTKLKPGINSDNKLLLTELATNFKNKGVYFIILIIDHNLLLVRFWNVSNTLILIN